MLLPRDPELLGSGTGTLCFPLIIAAASRLIRILSVSMPHSGLNDFPDGSDGKASAYNAGDPVSIPRLGRSPGEGNGNPLQYSCLENPMDRGAWLATVHGVAKSQTRLSNFTIYSPQ